METNGNSDNSDSNDSNERWSTIRINSSKPKLVDKHGYTHLFS